MKYMVLIYDNANSRDAFFGEGSDALMSEIDALMAELTESGELIGERGAGRPVEHPDRPGAGRRAGRDRRAAT